MVQPNDSIVVTPGTGATVATHLVSSKEYQVMMLADHLGHILGSRDLFCVFYLPVTNANNREVAELFNAHASKIVRVHGVWILASGDWTNTGQVRHDVNRISTVGTGGTVVTPRPMDESQAALDAAITAMYGATGGATLNWKDFDIAFSVHMVEGFKLAWNQLKAEIVLRANDGLQVKQSINFAAGTTGARILFSVE